MRNRDRNNIRALKVDLKYCHEQDWKIVQYIATGHLEQPAEIERSRPNFTEQLTWLGPTLSPSVKALEDAENMPYPFANM